MAVLCIIILLCLLPIALYNTNIVARRLSIVIILLWVLLLGISVTNPFDLFPVTDRTYLLCTLFVASFMAGITFTHNKTLENISENDNSRATLYLDKIIENKVFILLASFCVVFLFYLYTKTQAALEYQSVAGLRNEGGQDYLFEGNGLLGMIFNLFVAPFSRITHILLAYVILFRRKKILQLSIFGLNVILSAAINNGRATILAVIMYLFFVFYCCPFFSNFKNIKTLLLTIIVMLFVGTGIFAYVSFMTAQRMYGVEELNIETIELGLEAMGEHIVTYLVGPLRSLDYAFEHNYFDELGFPTLGQSTFGFLFGFIDLFTTKLGFDITFANEIIYDKLQNDWIWIGIDTNFAYTAIFNFYIDFGILGVLFLPALLGTIIKRICNSYMCNLNPIAFILLGSLFSVTVNCFFGWSLYYWTNTAYFIVLIVMNLYWKRVYPSLNNIHSTNNYYN